MCEGAVHLQNMEISFLQILPLAVVLSFPTQSTASESHDRGSAVSRMAKTAAGAETRLQRAFPLKLDSMASVGLSLAGGRNRDWYFYMFFFRGGIFFVIPVRNQSADHAGFGREPSFEIRLEMFAPSNVAHALKIFAR